MISLHASWGGCSDLWLLFSCVSLSRLLALFVAFPAKHGWYGVGVAGAGACYCCWSTAQTNTGVVWHNLSVSHADFGST